MKTLTPVPFQLESYNGTIIKVYGCLQCDIQIGQIRLTNCIFQVVDNDCSPILGTPEIFDNKITLDIENSLIIKEKRKERMTVSVNTVSRFAGLRLITKSNYYDSYGKSPETQIIAPQSTKAVKIEVDTISTSTVYALPEQILRNKNLEIYDQVVQVSPASNQVRIQVANKSNSSITLNAGEIVAKLHEVQVSSPKSPISGKFRQVLDELKIGELPTAIKQRLHSLIANFTEIFAIEGEQLGTTDAMSYKIDTGTAAPVASQRYRTPYYLRDEMKRIIKSNLDSGLLVPCSSPWAAPVLLVKKPNGKWRLVCDYRKLNTVTISNQYPLPEIDGLIDHMSKSKVFSTADLFTGFHQIPCSEDTKQKVAITTDFGQYTWTAMPMGGKNAPAVFQQMMDKIFNHIPSSALAIYLDDLCIHSTTYEENLATLEKVFKTLRRNNLKIRASKTELLKPSVKFCGAIIENGYRKPNPDKVKAVLDLRHPTNKKEAQSIFGLLNYHRNFVPHFASKTANITLAYKNGFKWTSAAAEALEAIKKEIASEIDKLKIPSPNTGQFGIETDASDTGIGAVLLFRDSEAEDFKPVAYLSQKFDEAQKNYNTNEKELLAGKRAMEKFSHYLLGRSFLWFTDNSCVNWAHRIKSRKAKIAKWLAEIGDFDFTTILKQSKEMLVSDCLSRQISTIRPKVSTIKRMEMKNLQEMDPYLHEIRRFHDLDRWPNLRDNKTEQLYRERDRICFGSSGELGIQKNGFRVIPPESLVEDIFKEYHDAYGHPGVAQSINEIQKKYFIPDLQKRIKTYVRTCPKCQKCKPSNNPLNAPMGKVEPPTQPFQKFAIDLIGPLPLTDNHHRYICVSTDLFSKKTYARPLKRKQPEEVCKAALDDWYRNPHMPESVLMDNGGEFMALRQWCDDKGIKVKLSPAYHPQTNGECENRNRTIKSRLKMRCDMENWDTHLPLVLHQMNSAKHSVTLCSPFEIETGYNGENPMDPYKTTITKTSVDFDTIHSRIEANHTKRQNSDNDVFPFKTGDLVLVKNLDQTDKMNKFQGPCQITQIRNQGLSFELRNLSTNQVITRHISHIKPYLEREGDNPTDIGKNEPQTPRPKPVRKRRKSYSQPVFTKMTLRSTHQEENPAPSPEPTSQSEPVSQESEVEQEEEETSEETVFYDVESNTTQQEDTQSIDSGGTEVAELTKNTQEGPKARKLISPVVQRIADLHDKALDKFIKDYKCGVKLGTWSALKSQKSRKLEKINEWIQANHPNWEQDNEGYFLIKHNALMLESKCYLSSFTIVELKVLAKHLDIQITFDTKPKTVLMTEFTKLAKEKFPFMKCTPAGNLIIDPAHFT